MGFPKVHAFQTWPTRRRKRQGDRRGRVAGSLPAFLPCHAGDPMTPRRAVHLVGSLPPDIATAAEAMDFVIAAAGPHLDGLMPTGETNRGRLYVAPIVEGLAKHPALEQLTRGDWSTRDERPTY